ncbi:hypothetical protein IWW38_004673, partial [Coemansia aciculifera]
MADHALPAAPASSGAQSGNNNSANTASNDSSNTSSDSSYSMDSRDNDNDITPRSTPVAVANTNAGVAADKVQLASIPSFPLGLELLQVNMAIWWHQNYTGVHISPEIAAILNDAKTNMVDFVGGSLSDFQDRLAICKSELDTLTTLTEEAKKLRRTTMLAVDSAIEHQLSLPLDSDARRVATKEVAIANASLTKASRAVDKLSRRHERARLDCGTAHEELCNAMTACSDLADFWVATMQLGAKMSQVAAAATQLGPLRASTGHESSRPTGDNEVTTISVGSTMRQAGSAAEGPSTAQA